MQQNNNWDVTLSMIALFEKILSSHKLVVSFTRERDIFFRIVRHGVLSPVNALLVNRYTIGVADVIRAKAEFPDLTFLVANGAWCGYTQEAKAHGTQQGIGVFIISELSGALFSKQPIGYVRKDAKGNPTYGYRNA